MAGPKVFYVQPGRAVVDGFCMPQQQKIINIMSFFHFCQGLAPSKASKASLETVVPVCMTCVFFPLAQVGPKMKPEVAVQKDTLPI